MNKTILSLLIVLSNLLAACSSTATAKTAASFEAPLSNQVEVHQDGVHHDGVHHDGVHHDGEDHGHDHAHLDPASATAEMNVVLVPSELVVGPNRFAVGLFDGKNRIIEDAEVHFHYFDLTDPSTPRLEAESDAIQLQTPDGLTTIFAQERTFDRPGEWGVEVQAHLSDGTTAVKRIGFEVLADSVSLMPGDLAPALDTPTATAVGGDLSQLTSAPDPNPAFHQLSLAEALTNGKPTVLLFATPAYCQTRFCGPAYDIINEVQQRYGQTVNFIHIEVYTGLPNPAANNWEMAPAMAAFGLSTEPWLYLLDRDGQIAYRVEGLVTVEEIEAQLRRLEISD